MATLFWSVIEAFNYVVLAYFVVLNGVYFAMTLVAFRELGRYGWRRRALEIDTVTAAGTTPPVTVIAPAYNEEATCVESVRSLLTLTYPRYQVLIVNDGSRDGTLARLVEAFALELTPRAPVSDVPTAPVQGVYRSRRHPNLWVIDKENGGKADALNAGLNQCRTPMFCVIDADSLLEREALSRVVRPFLEDSSTIAAGGIIRIVNGCTVKSGMVTDVRLPRNWLARLQVLEYLRAFLAGRMGWTTVGATLIISGAFGMFRRPVVVDAGGFAADTVGEDMELVVRLHRHCRERGIPYRVLFVPDPVAWTECPETVRQLGRQRDRWQRGLIDSLTRHRVMLGNARYGRIGLAAFPYFYLLEMRGPIIEMLGYLSFGITVAAGRASGVYVAAFLAVAVAWGIALSIAAVTLEEMTFRRYPRASDMARLFALAPLENLGYRQLSTWWRVRGTFAAWRGVTAWGAMERRGFGSSTAARGASPAPHDPETRP